MTAALHGVLVTFRRPADLAVTLRRLDEQTRRLDTLAVVDNDDDPAVRSAVTAGADVAGTVTYVPVLENSGPAGGLAVGVAEVLRSAADDDWVVFLDDDDPPRTDDMLAELSAFAESMARHDPSTGAVGLVGARFDQRTGMLARVPDDDLAGAVAVDYIGGGQLPLYRASAMRQVGLPDERLFFGFDDLEYGLRLGRAGRSLYMDGDICRRERQAKGLLGVDRRPSRTIASPGWREFYSTRNLVWILRQHGRHAAAARVLGRRVIAKSVVNAPRAPRAAWDRLRTGIRAYTDAYTSRMGRTVEPG